MGTSHPDAGVIARYRAALDRWEQTPAGLPTSSLSGSGAIKAAEDAAAEVFGVRHALLVPSGTVAISVAMEALGVGPGTSVVMPSLDWTATYVVAGCLGADRLVADVDVATATIDPDDVAAVGRADTKAVVVTHPHGVPADVDAVRAALPGVPIIEDASQSAGMRLPDGRAAGSTGDIGILSLGSSKLLSTDGGGLALTNDHDLLQRMVAVSQHPLRQRRALVAEVTDRCAIRRPHPMSAILLLDALHRLPTARDLDAASRAAVRRQLPRAVAVPLGTRSGPRELVRGSDALPAPPSLGLSPAGLLPIGGPTCDGVARKADWLAPQLFLAGLAATGTMA